jgi:hypothetical protein
MTTLLTAPHSAGSAVTIGRDHVLPIGQLMSCAEMGLMSTPTH